MKKATTLTELLNGYSGTKKTEDSTSDDDTVPYIEHQTTRFMQNEDETMESIDISMEQDSSPSQATSQIASQDKSNVSVQSFLMNSRMKKSESTRAGTDETEIIALDDDFNDEVDVDIEKFDGDGILPRGSRVTIPSNSKTTALKDLFSSFKQSKVNQVKLNASVVSNTFFDKDTKKNKRVATINEAPFPDLQLVEPSDDEICDRNLDLNLEFRREGRSLATSFSSDEYKALNAAGHLDNKWKRVKIAQKTRKHNKLWPGLMKPKSLKEVLLESALKDDVSKWITNAFDKLRRSTTRNKMLKRQRLEYDPLDAFVVDDDIDDDATTKEEFVPIMILFGDGIGKNTLIEVIMTSHQGQIFEINASGNRSKKDILDSLMEFSTTHYVKGQGSKGVILLDDVDVLFKEHDKFFWQTVEKVLLTSRRPIVMLCRDLNYVPSNLVQLAVSENSLFNCRRVSHQTITKFLERYCRKLGLEIDRNILQLLVTCSKRDIRKCLMDLEFCCTPPGELKVPDTPHRTTAPISEITEAFTSADLLSWSDVLKSETYWKSSFLQESDHTLMTPHALAALGGMSDDQERAQHDYLLDYRLHLVDKVNRPQLPFELNIGVDLENALSSNELTKLTKLSKLKEAHYSKTKRASVTYLSTRIGKQNLLDVRPRKTRNSRKIQEVIERFEGTSTSEDIDETVAIDFQVNNDRIIKEQINPYILKIAAKEYQVKQANREIFLEHCEGVERAQHKEVAWRLTQERLLKPIWFHADPKNVINSWN